MLKNGDLIPGKIYMLVGYAYIHYMSTVTSPPLGSKFVFLYKKQMEFEDSGVPEPTIYNLYFLHDTQIVYVNSTWSHKFAIVE